MVPLPMYSFFEKNTFFQMFKLSQFFFKIYETFFLNSPLVELQKYAFARPTSNIFFRKSIPKNS